MLSSHHNPLPNVNAAAPDWVERAWRALFPPRCAGCGLWCAELFCVDCHDALEPLHSPLCALCGMPFDPLAQVLASALCTDCRDNRYHAAPPLAALRAPFEYSAGMREAIHAFKYRGKTARAVQFATLLGEYLTRTEEAQVFPLEDLKLIVPVPLHGWRRWRRGYNQSTLLACALAHWLQLHAGLTVRVAEVLRRVRYTRPQVELSGRERERERNIHGAFALDEPLWREYSELGSGAFLLLDDVTTTGATLFECARVLQKSTEVKTAQLYALTLARSSKTP
jgi:ComF family protein